MDDFADTMYLDQLVDFQDAMFLEHPIDEPMGVEPHEPVRRLVAHLAENIIPRGQADRQDMRLKPRTTQQGSRDSSLRGLATEVLGLERARNWIERCDPLEAPLLNACLLRLARSSKPIDFTDAAAAVWA